MTVNIFMMIAATVMALLFGLALLSLKYTFEGTSRERVFRALLLFDGIALAAMLARPVFLRDAAWAGPALRVMFAVFVAQVIFTALVYSAVFLRWVRRKLSAPAPFSPSRRRLLKRAILYPASAAIAAGYGVTCGIGATVEREYRIPVKDLPESLKGFRIAQLSDIHLGMFFSLERLEELLKQAAHGKPDALVITGDIFDDVTLNPGAVALLDAHAGDFPRGIWYCNGNHEHFRGIERIREMLARTRIHVLVNGAEVAAEGERPLFFLGVDYPMHRKEEAFQADRKAFLEAAMEMVPERAVKVLLAHHPEFIDDAAERGVELTLTGHTHGSQFGILGIPLFPVFKYTRGMIQKGASYGYVHCGNGSWFPCRIGCPPEIAYFILEGKA